MRCTCLSLQHMVGLVYLQTCFSYMLVYVRLELEGALELLRRPSLILCVLW